MKYLVFSVRLYVIIVTLIKGHKNKIWFSQKQKVTGRGRPWQLEGGKKMVTEKISPLKAQQRLWVYKYQFSRSSGNSRTQAKTAQDNRAANRSHCQSSKKSKSWERQNIQETWQETPSATVSKQKATKEWPGLPCMALAAMHHPATRVPFPDYNVDVTVQS